MKEKSLENNRKTGEEFEKIAAIYLKEKGYKIRHTNWHFGPKELDIVAEHGGMLIVVEVKYSKSAFFRTPEEAVTLRKMKNIVDAAEAYIFTFDVKMETRFDIIAIVKELNGKDTITHIEDAFLAPLQ